MAEMKCLYHFPLVIDLWQERQFDQLPIIFIVITTISGIGVLICWAIVAKHMMRQLVLTINKYNRAGSVGKTQYNDLV